MPIFLLLAAAEVRLCESSKVFATAGFLFRRDETLCRSRLRDFIETRERLEPKRRRKRAKIFQGHNKSLFTRDRSFRPLPASRLPFSNVYGVPAVHAPVSLSRRNYRCSHRPHFSSTIVRSRSCSDIYSTAV